VLAIRAGALMKAHGSEAVQPDQSGYQIIEKYCEGYKAFGGLAFFRKHPGPKVELLYPKSQAYEITGAIPYGDISDAPIATLPVRAAESIREAVAICSDPAKFRAACEYWQIDADHYRPIKLYDNGQLYDAKVVRFLAYKIENPDNLRKFPEFWRCSSWPLIGKSLCDLGFVVFNERDPDTDIWAIIERDTAQAETVKLDSNNKRADADIDDDLASALEGLPVERARMVRSRAHWLAALFVQRREQEGTLICDAGCGFDAIARARGTKVNPRTLIDVHHRAPLAEGQRLTMIADFELLCPTCHRFEHAIIRANKKV
jgi:HNH endonuclease